MAIRRLAISLTPRIPRLFAAAGRCMALLSALAAAGCASGAKEASSPAPDVRVSVALDKAVYRPGEAMIATISIQNVSGSAKVLREPNFDSVRFFYGAVNSPQRAQRWPVYTPREEPLQFQTLQLQPGAAKERVFVLTRLTGDPGEYMLSVGYEQELPAMLPGLTESEIDRRADDPREAQVWARPISYQVSGPRFVKRDEMGVLLKEDAVDLCLRTLGKPASGVDTQLVFDEVGFLTWWVCLTVAPEFLNPGESAKRAFFVDPYMATVDRSRQAPVQLTLLRPRAEESSRIRARTPGAGSALHDGVGPTPPGSVGRRGVPQIE